MASGLTVTVALTHSLSPPLCVLIQKCHCKKDNQCELLLPPLNLKVEAFSRACIRITYSHQQQQQQQQEMGH